MKPLMRRLQYILATALALMAIQCNAQQMPDFGVAFLKTRLPQFESQSTPIVST